MRCAAEEAVQANESRDITVAFDGRWQRRGHTSQNGVVAAISVTCGKVIDVQVLSKYYRC